MKLKKVIMLILMFMISLSLFSVARAENIKVSNEYVDVVERGWWILKRTQRWRNIEIKVPAEYFTNIENVTLGEANELLFTDTRRSLEFQPYLRDGTKSYDPNLEIGQVNSDGSLTVKVSWMEQYDQSTELDINEGRINEFGNVVERKNVFSYEVGTGTPDEPVPSPEPDNDKQGNSTDNSPGGFYNPYEINVSNLRQVVEIKYDKVPFYFYISRNSADGTFLVDFDEKNKVVKFDYISDQKRVGYVKEHKNDTPYSQVGAESVNLVKHGIKIETVPEYIIKEVSNASDSVTPDGTQNIKCAFNYLDTSLSTYVPHAASYVFVCRTTQKSDDRDARERDVMYQFCGYNEPDEPAGFLETLCTKVLTFLGDLFMLLIKAFLGSDLTIDKIIFNEYDPVVIDLEGRTRYTWK